MPQTMTPITVQLITDVVGAFLGPNIVAAGAVGTFSENPHVEVKVQTGAEPERNREYAINGTIIWDHAHGLHEVITMNEFYCVEYDSSTQTATFRQNMPM